MKTFTRDMEVSSPWIHYIFDGSKKVEVRKNDPKNWGALKVGNLLNIISKETKESRLFEITETRIYHTLDDCIIAEGVRNLLPRLTTLDDARTVYLGFDGDDPEKIKKRKLEYEEFGCIIIELKPKVKSLENEKEDEEKTYIYSLMTQSPREAMIIHDHQINPKSGGDHNCNHLNDDGSSLIEYNNEGCTMGVSRWEKICNRCDKVWYED